MSWFEPKADKPKIPPAKALWAICPKCKSHMGKDEWKKKLTGQIGKKQQKLFTTKCCLQDMLI